MAAKTGTKRGRGRTTKGTAGAARGKKTGGGRKAVGKRAQETELAKQMGQLAIAEKKATGPRRSRRASRKAAEIDVLVNWTRGRAALEPAEAKKKAGRAVGKATNAKAKAGAKGKAAPAKSTKAKRK